MQHTATHVQQAEEMLETAMTDIQVFCTEILRLKWSADTLYHTTIHCNTLQHTATHCNTLHCTATHMQRV